MHIPIVQSFIGSTVAQAVSKKLGTEVVVTRVDLGFFNRIIIDNFYIKDHKQQNLLKASRLSVKINPISIFKGKIIISSIQLFGSKFNLYKESNTAKANFQFVLDSLASKDTLNQTPLDLKINSIIIRNGKVYYNILNTPHTPKRFNTNHIEISNLSGHIILNTLTNDSINVNIKRLALKEKSGIDFKNIQLSLDAGRQSAKLKKLQVQLLNSTLQSDSIIAFYRIKNKTFELPSLTFNGKFNKIDIIPYDLSTFENTLNRINHHYIGAFSFEGTSTSLNIKDFTLHSSDGGLKLKAGIFVKGGFKKPKWFISIPQLIATQTHISYIHKLITSQKEQPHWLTQLGTVSYTGELGGYGKELSTRAHIKTNIGNVQLDLGIHGKDINGHINSSNINIKELTDNQTFGNISLKLDFNGIINNNKLSKISLKGVVPLFDYNNYSYKNITINGSYEKDIINGKLALNDPNGNIDIDGRMNISPKNFMANIEAKANQLNINALKITNKYPQTNFSFVLSTNFTGKDINSLNGRIDLKDFKMVSDKLNYALEEFNITAQNKGNTHVVNLHSDFADAQIEGFYQYQTLYNSVLNLINSRLSTIPGLPKSKGITKNNFTINATLYKADWLNHFFNIPLDVTHPITIAAKVNDKEQDIDLTLTANNFVYAGKEYQEGWLNITSPGDSLCIKTNISSVNSQGTKLDLGLNAIAIHNQLSTQLSFNNNQDKRLKGEINADTRFLKNSYGVSTAAINIKPSTIMIGDSTWTVEPSTVNYSKDLLAINNFKISHKEQFLNINGNATKSLNESLQVDFNDIDVDYILNFINFTAVSFGGQATGHALISGALSSKPEAFATCDVKQFTFENGPMGTLAANVLWNSKEEQIEIDAIANEADDKNTLIEGYVSPKRNYIDLDINAQNCNLAFVESFTKSFMKNVNATGKGSVKLSGPLNMLNLTGKIEANGSLDITSLNTTYYLKNDIVTFIPNEIRFENDSIYDRNGNIGIVNGTLHHKNLTNLTYDIGIKAKKLLAYDTHTFGENTFYGTAFVTGDCNIKGKSGEVVIDVNGTTEKGSTLVYDVSNKNSLSDNSFIHWNTYKDSLAFEDDSIAIENRTIYKKEIFKPKDIPTNIHINFAVNCTTDASVKLIMDSNSGDHIILKGEGGLRASYYNKGGFELFGNYLVQEGVYKLTIQNVIKRDFTFQPGGVISFGGDPFAAALNLKAVYTLNSVSLSELKLGRSFSSNNIKVNCLMNISGTPESPKIDFGLDMPTINSDIKQMVFSLINGEEEMNQQVLYLLAVGRFYTKAANAPDNSNIEQQSQASLAMQSILSGTISQQINSVLNSVINSSNWSFGANISTGNNGWNNAEYEGLLSGRLLNDRLLINGQFGYRDNINSTTNFIGDFSIRYLLTPKGGFSVNIYNQTNDRYFTKNSLTTQGIGILIKKEFSSWRDLFGRKRKKKANDSIDVNKKDVAQ